MYLYKISTEMCYNINLNVLVSKVETYTKAYRSIQMYKIYSLEKEKNTNLSSVPKHICDKKLDLCIYIFFFLST